MSKNESNEDKSNEDKSNEDTQPQETKAAKEDFKKMLKLIEAFAEDSQALIALLKDNNGTKPVPEEILKDLELVFRQAMTFVLITALIWGEKNFERNLFILKIRHGDEEKPETE